jgi:hypothetical protein
MREHLSWTANLTLSEPTGGRAKSAPSPDPGKPAS